MKNEFDDARDGENVRDVSAGIMNALKSLKESDCFEAVTVKCEAVDQDAEADGNTYTDLTVSLREKRLVSLKGETFVTSSGSEGGVQASLSLNNPFGYAEKISFSGNYGTHDSAGGRVECFKRRIGGFPFNLEARATQDTVSRAEYSSYDESSKSIGVNLSHDEGFHSFGCVSEWRDIIPIRCPHNEFEYAASGLILAQARPSLKNSFHYIYTNDNRDNRHCPTRGSYLQMKNEIAGFGGDVNFIKSQFKVQNFFPILSRLISGLSSGFSFHAGILYPITPFSPLSVLNSRSSSHKHDQTASDSLVGGSTCISDRFWLGGPLTMRGFNHKGVGPRTSPKLPGAKSGDSLGGDLIWSLGYSIYAPFPYAMLNDAGLRVQLYTNVGNLCAWETSLRTLISGARATVGVGLLLPMPIGRVEANYGYVLRANSRDDQRRFQLGFGVDFM